MKKIHLLVLKAFIRPFIITFFIVMFVLLMFFLFKYIDDLIGKGFEWYIILQLLWYASATNVAMALPLAVLLSSIMTFGSLGENYELVAIKSAGLSLQKAMRPLIIAIAFLSIAAFVFSDYMLPKANWKMISLLYDMRRKSANFMIQERIFNNSIDKFSIRVQKKDPDGQTLHGVLIYDHTSTDGGMTVLMAEEGHEIMSKDKQLILKLKNGVRYVEMRGPNSMDPRKRFMRQRFKETEERLDLSAFEFQRTDESAFKNLNKMLNLKQLKYVRDSVQLKADSNERSNFQTLKYQYSFLVSLMSKKDTLHVKARTQPYTDILDLMPPDNRTSALASARESVRMISETIKTQVTNYKMYREPVIDAIIEYHKKFTLSVSCLLLFSIGAPLGAIIRKGGLGLPVVMSVLFFLVYHVISTIAEKSAKDGIFSPAMGMWFAIIVLTPVGIFLTYKATIDSTLFDIDAYKLLIQKIFRRKKARQD